MSAEPLALALARAKAQAVARMRSDAVVIGSDQVVSLGEAILGKPGSAQAAVAQLQAMSGRSHRLITALAVLNGDNEEMHIDITTLKMRRLDDAAIRRYVDADQPIDCAGSYKLESRGIALFDSIESSDHTAIIGLPMIALARILRGFGLTSP
jgi:septum formation protein